MLAENNKNSRKICSYDVFWFSRVRWCGDFFEVWGTGGRRFESCCSDQYKALKPNGFGAFPFLAAVIPKRSGLHGDYKILDLPGKSGERESRNL